MFDVWDNTSLSLHFLNFVKKKKTPASISITEWVFNDEILLMMGGGGGGDLFIELLFYFG